MGNKKNTVIIIAGPTAVGKTSIAIEVAKYFSTGIISADSRQCYRELNIGVARPSTEELNAVQHHFIASHSIHEKITAADFEKYALEKASEIFKSHPMVVMAGGTGLYIKAFCEGLDEIPVVDEAIRQQIKEQYEKQGLPWLQQEVKLVDPGFYEVGEVWNPQRLMRALEVCQATGRSILSFRRASAAERDFNIIKVALELPKDQLHHNINRRVDQMMDMGLLDEVKTLLPFAHLNALQTVGYKELFDHLNGKLSLEAAVDAIKKNTRQYAKRQMTWFKKDKGFSWFSASGIKPILQYLQSNAL